MTTKVHAVTDGLGNPLRFLLSSGNRNDICMARALLESFTLNGKLILAGKGYDSDKFVHWVEERGGIRPLAKLSKAVKVADTSNQGKSEGKALSPVTVTLREDTKPFEKTDGVFNKDTFS